MYGDSPITIFEIFLLSEDYLPFPHHDIQIFLWLRKYNIHVHTIYMSHIQYVFRGIIFGQV